MDGHARFDRAAGRGQAAPVAGFLIVAALFILGLVIGLAMLFNGLLQRSRDGGMPAWLSMPLAGAAALAVVGGLGWAFIVTVCSGMEFH